MCKYREIDREQKEWRMRVTKKTSEEGGGREREKEKQTDKV